MTSSAKARRGSLTVELLLLLPVLLAVVLAAVVLSLLAAAEQRVEAASAAGARVAAQGGDTTAIANAVQASFGSAKWQDAEVKAKLTDPTTGLTIASGESVEVVVQINAAKVVPDMLGFIGLSLKDRTISARTSLRKE